MSSRLFSLKYSSRIPSWKSLLRSLIYHAEEGCSALTFYTAHLMASAMFLHTIPEGLRKFLLNEAVSQDKKPVQEAGRSTRTIFGQAQLLLPGLSVGLAAADLIPVFASCKSCSKERFSNVLIVTSGFD